MFINLLIIYGLSIFFLKLGGKDIITKLDGTKIKYTGRMDLIYIYNDYTDLNMKVIDEYGLDLKVFYNEIPKIDKIINEIPIEKLNVLIDKTIQVIENSRSSKNMVFNLEHIKQFVKTCIELLSANLDELLSKQ